MPEIVTVPEHAALEPGAEYLVQQVFPPEVSRGQMSAWANDLNSILVDVESVSFLDQADGSHIASALFIARAGAPLAGQLLHTLAELADRYSVASLWDGRPYTALYRVLERGGAAVGELAVLGGRLTAQAITSRPGRMLLWGLVAVAVVAAAVAVVYLVRAFVPRKGG